MSINEDFLRHIDSLHREKGIDREQLIESIEAALVSAARKRYPKVEELRVRIDRKSGVIRLLDGDIPFDVMDPATFGRIAAQTARQVMIQRIREAESDVVYEEFTAKIGTIVNGVIQRVERGTVICNIGKSDGILPRQEQIPSENYRPNERIRAYVTQVRKKGNKIIIILSRTHPDLVRELFELEVPEIYERIVEIKVMVREPGYRTKIAVYSSDSRVDAVGACVGVRGSRIRNIVEELGGEKIDIVRWNESPELFIRNALSPSLIDHIEFDRNHQRARVIVPEEQLSLAIGRKGQNVRLSSRLTGWNLDIMTINQHSAWLEKGRKEIASLPGINESIVNNMQLVGFGSFHDIMELGIDRLKEIKGIGEKKAQEIYNFAVEGYRKRLETDSRELAEAKESRTSRPGGPGELLTTEAVPLETAEGDLALPEAEALPEALTEPEALAEESVVEVSQPVEEEPAVSGVDGTTGI
ncbi:MAG: transcription termination factor NusA [Planctomycetota bacterium]|nr:transcription termination factor NusA [Planctomycetota bacterium]